jgi:hypothetical protein
MRDAGDLWMQEISGCRRSLDAADLSAEMQQRLKRIAYVFFLRSTFDNFSKRKRKLFFLTKRNSS